MEFNEKLVELRKSRGLTQEELAEKLYVTRSAVSKWESGRGYPNLDSLKAIADLFSVTVDELLSADGVIRIAEAQQCRTEARRRDLVSGLVDICTLLFIFLPLFTVRAEGRAEIFTLISSGGVATYLKAVYFVAVGLTVLTGGLTLALRDIELRAWTLIKTPLSLALGAVTVLIFTVSLQPYASTLAFALLAIKAVMLIKRQ